MDDREIIQWDKRLTDQARRGWDNYKHLHIDLNTARINQSYLIAGEYLYVEESSSTEAVAKIRLNRVNNDELDLEKGVKIETVFIEIFITNDALEDEWIDLVFGINFKYKKKIANGGLSYIDRGELAVGDFAVGDFTIDGAWHNLDLSGIIDIGTVLVVARLYITAALAKKRVRFMSADFVNDANRSQSSTQVDNTDYIVDILIRPNADGVIKYKFDAGVWTTADLIIRGWFM